MRHLKRFNEELKGSTFRSAATKLKQLGHIRRSQEIESYAKGVEEREEKQRRMLDELANMQKKQEEEDF